MRLICGASPSASAKPRHWLSIPALPSVTTQQESNGASETEHVIKTERRHSGKAVIAKQTASGVTHSHVTIITGFRSFVRREHFVETPQQRTATGNLHLPARDLDSTR